MPLTHEQLLALVASPESEHVERKESASDMKKISEAVCALANDLGNRRQPGYLLVGVRDNGQLSGLQASDQLLTQLGGLQSNGNILPPPAISLSVHNTAEGDIAVVEVQPSDYPPVRYHQVCWVRVGPRRAKASEQQERILTERRQDLAKTFDARACLESELSDLDLTLFAGYRSAAVDPEVIAENHRSITDQLAALRFYSPRLAHPTYAALLLFGTNSRYYLPGAYVQYVQFQGGEAVDQAEISGDLASIIRELYVRCKTLIQTRMRSEGDFREVLLPTYPELAIRELLLNALMHRDYQSNTPVRFYAYENHLEITNPGGLYGEVDAANFPRVNSYRNPILAEALKTLGFVERFGFGVQRAQDRLKKNGNPEAEFEIADPNYVRVIVRARTT
jgi:ATP-dependent DNA helicase RecG